MKTEFLPRPRRRLVAIFRLWLELCSLCAGACAIGESQLDELAPQYRQLRQRFHCSAGGAAAGAPVPLVLCADGTCRHTFIHCFRAPTEQAAVPLLVLVSSVSPTRAAVPPRVRFILFILFFIYWRCAPTTQAAVPLLSLVSSESPTLAAVPSPKVPSSTSISLPSAS